MEDPGHSYIGKTKRYLNTRVAEHRKTGSAIFNHISACKECQNANLIQLFSVIDRGNTDFDLQILEALHITKARPSINKQLSCDGTSFILSIF